LSYHPVEATWGIPVETGMPRKVIAIRTASRPDIFN